jgi:asparagine synthase (glutamine-hydrolysing)
MMLRKVDRASMYFGLEVRVPLLDVDLLERAAQLHPATCMDGDLGKIVLRRALGRFVPQESIPRHKRGFDVPVGQWLRHELAGRTRALLLERDPFPEGLFDRAVLAEYVDDHVQRGIDRTQGLWNLLALQLWADAHLRTPTTV